MFICLITHSFAALTRLILFLPLEHTIHVFSLPCTILYISTSDSTHSRRVCLWTRKPLLGAIFLFAKESKTHTFYFNYNSLWRRVERREMKTERLNIKETLPIVRLKTHSACNYKYVILSKDLKTGLYVRCKCKRKWKCKRVDTSKANTRKERYASAVEAFLEDGRQWLSFYRFTRVSRERKCELKKMKICLLLALTLAFASTFALGWFPRAIIPFICICVCVFMWLIDRARCGY